MKRLTSMRNRTLILLASLLVGVTAATTLVLPSVLASVDEVSSNQELAGLLEAGQITGSPLPTSSIVLADVVAEYLPQASALQALPDQQAVASTVTGSLPVTVQSAEVTLPTPLTTVPQVPDVFLTPVDVTATQSVYLLTHFYIENGGE